MGNPSITPLPIGLDPRELEKRRILSSLGINATTPIENYPTPGFPVLQRRTPQEIAPPVENLPQLQRREVGTIPELEQLGEAYKTQYPDYTQYQPTTRRRVLSDIAGAGYGIIRGPYAGMQLATDISDQPYTEQVRRFGKEIAPLQARAGIALEQQKSQNEARKAIAEQFERIMRGESEYGKYQTGVESQRFLESPEYQAQQEAIRRAGIRPQAPHYFEDAQGNIVETDPTTGKQRILGKGSAETPAERERLKMLEHENRLKEIAAREKGIRDRPPKAGAYKAVTPTQEQVILEDLYTNPKFRNFITQTKTGKYYLKPPSDAETNEDWKTFVAQRASSIADLQAKLSKGTSSSDEWEEVDENEE